MGGLLFVTQAMLDSWAEQGKIDLVGDVMKLLAGDGKGRSYALEPAVRFLEVVGGEGDPNGLVHKVKSLAQLRELGGEAMDDSCIVGDVAYEVQPGFLAEAAALQAAARAPAGEAPAVPAAEPQVRAPVAVPHLPPIPAPAPTPVVASGGGAPGRPSRPGNTPLPRDLEEKRKEAEALARFLLENLS